MKKIFLFIIFLAAHTIASAQILPSYNTSVSYNYEPEILEGKQTNLVLAFSMRKLFINYDGPLVRLRRGGDNAEKDFYPAAVSGIVDVDAIDEWRGANTVTLVIWYNQNGTTKHAVQNTLNSQPLFYADADRPYFIGDGIDDHLVVNASTKLELTNNGAEGSVLTVMKATQKGQYNFGFESPTSSNDRWSVHFNWSNNSAYIDLGAACCSHTRSFVNSTNTNLWKAYTIIRTSGSAFANINGVSAFTATYNPGWRLSNSASNFYILNARPGVNTYYSTSSFTEFIMYNTDIPAATYSAIETDQVSFWKL